MKAFVIKFNNDYYWCGYNNSDKQLRKAVLYKSIKMAEETAKDCMTRTECIRPYANKIESYKIIEATIVEGDLEQQFTMKDKEIEELKTRVSELEDKDWYEECIKQLEEQNNNLIKERDELAFEKRNTFGLIEKMEVKLVGVTKEKIQEIRKQVCDEIRNAIDNEVYELRGDNNRILSIRAGKFNKILEQIEKGE